MKKLMIGAFALLTATVIISCNQKGQQTPANWQAPADSTTETTDSTQVPEDSTTILPDTAATDSVNPNSRHGKLISIVEKAQEKGKGWSVAEWKKAYKEVLKLAQPTLKSLQELNEKLQENPNSVDALATFSARIREYEQLDELITKFKKTANDTENGKAAISDQTWLKQIMMELELPEKI